MKNKNFLSRIPIKSKKIKWDFENEKIVITVENKGFANRLMQILINKPKMSKIHLDEIGSFIWQIIDGKKTIYDISYELKNKFGKAADPLYFRLQKYFKTLYECRFIVWEK